MTTMTIIEAVLGITISSLLIGGIWVANRLNTKNKTVDIQEQGMNTYKSVVDALNSKVLVLEQNDKEKDLQITKLTVRLDAVVNENVGLTKEINLLKQVQPSKAFEEMIKQTNDKIISILEEMKKSRLDFMEHASSDAEQFEKMWQQISTTNDIAINNNIMLKKLCKEV